MLCGVANGSSRYDRTPVRPYARPYSRMYVSLYAHMPAHTQQLNPADLVNDTNHNSRWTTADRQTDGNPGVRPPIRRLVVVRRE